MDHREGFVCHHKLCQTAVPIVPHGATSVDHPLLLSFYMSSRPTTNRTWTGQSRPYSTGGQSRPWTAQSARPTTARPQTAASVRHECSFVVAVLEGRGISREVGIAALDRDTGKVILVQVSLDPRKLGYMRLTELTM